MLVTVGLLLAPIGLPALRYTCIGDEVFPIYTGSPFIYRSASLATSMAHDYYIVGFVLDIIIWGIIIFFVDQMVMRFFRRGNRKILPTIYTGFKGLLIVFSLLVLFFELQTAGQALHLQLNLDNEASAWGMQCSPEWTWEH